MTKKSTGMSYALENKEGYISANGLQARVFTPDLTAAKFYTDKGVAENMLKNLHRTGHTDCKIVPVELKRKAALKPVKVTAKKKKSAKTAKKSKATKAKKTSKEEQKD